MRQTLIRVQVSTNRTIEILPFLVMCLPLLNILAKAAANEGFSATIKAVFIAIKAIKKFINISNAM